MQSRKRDLALLLVCEALAMIFGSVLGHPQSHVPAGLSLGLMMVDLTVLQFLLYRVTAGYAKGKGFKVFYGLLVLTQFILNAFTNLPVPIDDTFQLMLVTYPLSLLTFCIIFYFIMQDMFANKHEMTYSLLAASCAYFMIAQIFGYILTIASLQDTSLLGVDIKTGQDLVRRTFEISHYVVAGFDIPDGVAEMLKNLAVVEAFVSNLYIIFVVGRLMANEK